MRYVEGKSNLVDKDGVLTVPASALNISGFMGPYGKGRFTQNVYKLGDVFVLFSKHPETQPPAPPPKDELMISTQHVNARTKELDSDEREAEDDTADYVAHAVRNLKVGAGRRRKTRRKTGRKTKKSKKSRRAL
jgi:hypothetical protein